MGENPGDKVGRWTLVSRCRTAGGRAGWACLCECGSVGVVVTNKLRSGFSRSCGCLTAEVAGATSASHKMTGTATYRTWASMHQRCSNPKNKRWDDYGGRGIRVCDRWSLFENFLADMGERPRGASIDRIDNDGNYEPGNCRWASSHEQSRNKRTSRMLTLRGVTKCASDWAAQIGCQPTRIFTRLRRGWTVERALKEIA